MGVNGLTGVLKRFAPKSISTVKPSAFANKTVAVDASCHLNKFIYGDDPHPYKHIHGFYLLSLYFNLNKIKPIFVFDGANRIAAKKREQEKREQQRFKISHSLRFEQEQALRLQSWLEIDKERLLESKQLLNKTADSIGLHTEERFFQKLSDIESDLLRASIEANNSDKYTKTVRTLVNKEKQLFSSILVNELSDIQSSLQSLSAENQANRQSLEKRSARVTQELRNACQEFLVELGHICFSCDNHEAEAMCANLGKLGRTSATISEDLDTLAFGDQPLIRYFFSGSRPILVINPVIAREQLGLSKESFIDFCILCGTDFSGTITGIGPIRALSYIQKYKTIEGIVEDLHNINPKYSVQPSFDHILARKVFKNLPPIPIEDFHYEESKADSERITELLQLYEIDYIEAEAKVRATVYQESIVEGADPFNTRSNLAF
ncbi:PIN domain-like protein [Sporodiniella umbellata]|nr:PIN domain-like protein [Sporodiniella umbellata]